MTRLVLTVHEPHAHLITGGPSESADCAPSSSRAFHSARAERGETRASQEAFTQQTASASQMFTHEALGINDDARLAAVAPMQMRAALSIKEIAILMTSTLPLSIDALMRFRGQKVNVNRLENFANAPIASVARSLRVASSGVSTHSGRCA